MILYFAFCFVAMGVHIVCDHVYIISVQWFIYADAKLYFFATTFRRARVVLKNGNQGGQSVTQSPA